MKTFTPSGKAIERRWYIVDASDKVLGRLSTEVARILMGKHKPTWTPHLDCGDYVVVVNCAKVRVTGDKLQQKIYSRHSGYPGGLKQRSLAQVMERFPDRVVRESVRGMLPHTSLGADMLRKLRVFPGPQHEHVAQQPITLDVAGRAGERNAPVPAAAGQ